MMLKGDFDTRYAGSQSRIRRSTWTRCLNRLTAKQVRERWARRDRALRLHNLLLIVGAWVLEPLPPAVDALFRSRYLHTISRLVKTASPHATRHSQES